MPRFHLTVETDPDPADAEAVRAGLLAFNVVHAGEPGQTPLNVFVRDEAGRVVGGLLGWTQWEWLYVDKLWLPEEARGEGTGSRLLALAEDEARARGCRGAHLSTLEYQARDFYERHGYQVFGVLDDYPPGFRRYHMKKTLAAEPPAAG